MKVLVMVRPCEDGEDKAYARKESLEAMGKFNQQLVDAGVLLEMAGLEPSSKGKRLSFRGARKHIVDGPFSEAKELVGGFWIWQVSSMDEAMEWANRCPNPNGEGAFELEIRAFANIDDYR